MQGITVLTNMDIRCVDINVVVNNNELYSNDTLSSRKLRDLSVYFIDNTQTAIKADMNDKCEINILECLEISVLVEYYSLDNHILKANNYLY